MKSYHDSMDELRFTDAQKQAMTNRLLTAEPIPHRTLPRRRVVVAAAAAVLVLAVGTAGATGVLRSAAESLSGLFGSSPAQTEIIDQIGHPIGASDTDNGVTITADAILGDTYSYAIVYSIQRDDGQPLVENMKPLNGCLPLSFETSGTSLGWAGGSHGSAYFYDADPTDPSIQYVEMMTADEPVEAGTARVKFQDLSVYDDDMRDKTIVAEGTWKLSFDAAFGNTSVSLPAGQAFQLSGMDAVLNSVSLSPLSIQVNYTVNSEVQWDKNAGSGKQNDHDRQQSRAYLESLPILLTFRDGSTLDMTNSGGGLHPEDGKTICQKGEIFDQIHPLDEIVSVTVGDITLPVSQT